MIPKFAFDTFNPSTAAAFIAQFEGFAPEAYLCPAKVWTIGYGHTGNVYPGDRVTQEQALQILAQDLVRTQYGLAPYIRVTVTQGQFIALMSLAFNLGVNGVAYDCPKLMQALNSGNVQECAKQFLDCDQASGRRLPGLTRRRQAEARLFLGS